MGPEHEAQWRKDYQVRLPGLLAGLPALMLIPLIPWVVFSLSWRVCVLHRPEGPPWMGPGPSLSRSPFRYKNPKIPTVVSIRLRKCLRPSALHMLLAAGTTGPGRPPTAHHWAVLPIQVRPQTEDCPTGCFTISNIELFKGPEGPVPSSGGRFRASMCVFQIVMGTRSARQKPHKRPSGQIWKQTSPKVTVRSWFLGSCVENRPSGKCCLISDPT